MSEDCPRCVFNETESNCPGCFEGSHYKPKPQTNADRIRAMTDEELAEFLDCYCVSASWECPKHHETKCHDCWLDWLKQEAERW